MMGISWKSRILPLEIKSGKTGKMKSLWQYIAKKGSDTAVRMDLAYRKNYVSEISHKVLVKGEMVEAKTRLLALPLFCIEYLPSCLEEMFT